MAHLPVCISSRRRYVTLGRHNDTKCNTFRSGTSHVIYSLRRVSLLFTLRVCINSPWIPMSISVQTLLFHRFRSNSPTLTSAVKFFGHIVHFLPFTTVSRHHICHQLQRAQVTGLRLYLVTQSTPQARVTFISILKTIRRIPKQLSHANHHFKL